MVEGSEMSAYHADCSGSNPARSLNLRFSLPLWHEALREPGATLSLVNSRTVYTICYLLFCGNLNVATSFYCRPWWPGSVDWRDRVRLPNHSWSLLRLCTTRKVCQVEKAPEEPSKLANGRVQDKPHWNAQKQSGGHCRRGHRLWEINAGKRQFIEAPILVIYLSQICCKKGTRFHPQDVM